LSGDAQTEVFVYKSFNI